MNHLFENDINFLLKYTKLSVDKLILLIEEEKDFDLVINSLTSNCLQKEEVFSLSFPTFIKLIIFKYTHDIDYSMEEKKYISKVILNYFPRLQKRINFSYLSRTEPSERLSQYYLVLMGLFYKRLKNNFFTPQIWNRVDDGFRKGSCRDVAYHLKDWVNILHKIEEEDWFLTSKTKDLPICEPKKIFITR